ncbi:WhiB family transcriptional regulator [Streptomyces chilikensis]|uniref:Transcriptional regulator WhiB n=1 Tax=Streptomyces chilikensis TaxID=1194079 RepID=A0ABV3ERE7_9ACTN
MTANAPANRYATRHVTKTQNWRAYATCAEVGPDMFFPDSKGAAVTYTENDAKKVCRHCPVIKQCLEYAVTSGQEAGVWGGLNPRELKKLRKQRGLGAVREPHPKAWDPPKVKPAPIGIWRPKPTALDRVLGRRDELMRLWDGGELSMKEIAQELGTNQSIVEQALRVIGQEQQAAAGLEAAA